MKPGQMLAVEVLRETLRHWQDWSEPMSLSQLQSRFAVAFYKLKTDSYFTTFMERLEEAGLFHLERAKNGKRWVFAEDIWASFTPEQRAHWKAQCLVMKDTYRS
jgi:hypothetical protein